jgi:mannose-6-phosphate isomerase-like protein (cupin superfamily)
MLLRKIWEESDKKYIKEKLLINSDETETIAVGYVAVESDESTQTGLHDDEEEIYVILKGKAILSIGDEKREVSMGDVAYVPRNNTHSMKCISEEKLEYLYFANWPR